MIAERFTDEDARELQRLEAEYEQLGGDAVTFEHRPNYNPAADSIGERVWELRSRRGDAQREVTLDVALTVRLRGEWMSEPELASLLGGNGTMRALEREVERCLQLDLASARYLAHAPDGNRSIVIDELLAATVKARP